MSTESALFSTTLTLSSWPRSEVITSLNSSETSSFAGSNSNRIRSQRAANQEQTSTKSKERAMRCFSPLRMPGVSTSVMCFKIPLGALQPAPSKRAKKELPKVASPDQAREGLTASVAPGVLRSSRACEMATTRSVEGSGPMFAPGYFRPSRCSMKVVFPVEYCPRSSTEGLASKSDSVRQAEKKEPNLKASSTGLTVRKKV